jgi:uncharacterized protein YdaU (DUF1376 family)
MLWFDDYFLHFLHLSHLETAITFSLLTNVGTTKEKQQAAKTNKANVLRIKSSLKG